MKYFVYIIRCHDNSLYTGITTNVQRRYQQHILGNGAKYTRAHKPRSLEAYWSCANKSQASKMEYYIKKLNKQQKEDVIKNNQNLEKYFNNKLQLCDYNREF